MNFSFLVPSRNGVEFLEWSYNSIRKNQGEHIVEILVLDDISDKDNTWEWCEQVQKKDPYFKAFRNTEKERYGISGGFKFLYQKATQDIICHWHNDMYLTEGALDAISENIDRTKVICLTRIEPPIYNPGPEKIVWQQAPIDLEEWDEQKFLDFLPIAKKQWENKTTEGHFVPFFMYREEYNKIGSNDTVNFFPQSRDDSDLAFRFVLAGYRTLQLPFFVFHFASRGNRRSKHETTAFQDNPAWTKINIKSTRNFIRKWGTLRMHDKYLKPKPPRKYDTGLIIVNCTLNLLRELEPWADRVYVDSSIDLVNQYIQDEQPNTEYDLSDKIKPFQQEYNHGVLIIIDGATFTNNDIEYLFELSTVLQRSGSVGEFKLGNINLVIKSLKSYENDLIYL